MRLRFCHGLISPLSMGLACLLLAGCAGRTAVTPEESLALLRTGKPVLHCREACLTDWQRVQPQAAQLEASRHFQDLAVLVIRVGYQDDLSLYYLGRAAEGLNYRLAAASYYRQSAQLSGTAVSCQYLSRQCGGVVLPKMAAARLAAVERMLNPNRARRTGPAPPGPEAPEAASGEVAPAEMAAPWGGPAPIPAPIPVARPVGPGTYDYIEPPPAAR